MLSSSASRFDSMPAQPPTPPKEVSRVVDDAISFLDDSNEVERALSKSLLERRPSLQGLAPSPAPSQESAATSTSKKVGFSPHTVFHQLPGQDRPTSPGHRIQKRSPSTRSCKPLKSILKAVHATPLTPDDLDTKLNYFSPDVAGSVAKMLQSVLAELASQSVSNRLDAYMALNGALQAYSDLPDPAALTQKLGLLSQFLARDMVWKNSDGKLNANIVIQALKLANFLLFNDTISAAFDDDFRCFLVDRSTTVMEAADIPKQIMKAHVHLLAQSKLSSPVMTAVRADKILSALQTIEQRCSGNNIVSARLVIYQRLLDQTPTLMLTRIRDWLEQTFHCMLSSFGDIRGRAIDTCTKGGIRLGTQALAAKAVSDLLDIEIEEGQSYFDYLSTKMLDMLPDKEVAPCVPRIWSAIVLYFRNRKKPVEKWPRFKSWLTIMQKCLNSSDISVRYEAILAWNKLVYTTMSDTSPSAGLMSMLKMPILSGIDKRGRDTFSRQIRQYTLDCYHNLLHYGLKPSLTAAELEAAWQALVEPVLSSMARASPKGRTTACRILHGLFSSTGGVWNTNAALVTAPIKSEELPRLEPRWVRSHVANVLKILQPAIQSSLWVESASNLALASTWLAFMQIISDAGAQEVKTSSDLKQAIALLVGLFRQLWQSQSQSPADGDIQRWLNNYSSLLDTTVKTIGPGHFTEDFLATSENDVIEVAPTPSMKRSKRHSAPQSPMVILLRPFFLANGVGIDAKIDDQSAAFVILQRFVSSRPSSLATLDLLSRSLSAMRSTPSDSTDSPKEPLVWETFARCTLLALRSYGTREQQQAGALGQLLRHCVEIMTAGTATVDNGKAPTAIISLYDAMYAVAKEAAGDGAVVIGVAEPVAKGLTSVGPSLSLHAEIELASHALSKAVWPKNRQSIEAARRTLWGVGLAPHKATLFDPFDHTYALVVNVMTSMYSQFEDSTAGELRNARSMLVAAVSFLETAPISLLLTGLRRTQGGFAIWVQDEAKKTAAHVEVSRQIVATWQALLKLVNSVPSSDSNLLKALETLLVAGFASPHRQIVNDTIVFWNGKFGAEESLEYPNKLESVLRARMIDASIDLPTFPDSNADHVPATLPEFFETESQTASAISLSSHPRNRQGGQEGAARYLQVPQSVYFTAARSPAAKSTMIPHTVDRRSAASNSSTPKARLRHDDSQIQFAPIDSSPIRFEEDSQHLTEHQKEVQARQIEEAQMYPGLSSSPMAQSTALPRALPKRLDFSSKGRANEDDGPGTPTALPDAAGLMSDDLPSSPTPSSTKDTSQAARDLDDDHASDQGLDEPPSSPPRSVDGGDNDRSQRNATAIGPDDTTVMDITDLGPTNEGDGAETNMPGTRASQVEDAIDGEQPNHEDCEELNYIASDSILPTEQLQLEAEAAENDRSAAAHQMSGPIEAAAISDDMEEGEQLSPRQHTEGGTRDATRVEDSFIGQPGPETVEEQDAPDSQGSRRSSRKRKRSSSVVYTAKKQKSASPLKRLLSSFWPTSQQDNDDMEDEIVVASSQRSQSPDSPRVQQSTASPSQRNEPLPDPTGDPSTDAATVKQEVMAPPKRRSGRPRKSATPTPSLSQGDEAVVQTRPLKRRVSAISTASDAETDASSSFVKDTPAPSKSRKGRKAQSASQTSETSSPQPTFQTARLARRTATAVMVSPPGKDLDATTEPPADAVEAEVADEEVIEVATSQKPAPPASATTPVEAERPRLTPRSILGRLRDALTDFVGMRVSTSEAREFDDVLFEFRREVHEADRRGRGGEGQREG